MFSSLSQQQNAFASQNYDGFMPGYTGYCPTLKFHCGHSYGSTTQEILKEMRRKHFYENVEINNKTVLQPIMGKDEFLNFTDNCHEISPEHPPITGYTGHIPRVKDDEELLSHSYHIAVIDDLKRLQQEKQRFENLNKSYNQVLNDYENFHK